MLKKNVEISKPYIDKILSVAVVHLIYTDSMKQKKKDWNSL